MALDKTKIFAQAVDVFLAAAGTGTGTPGDWTDVGWCEGGKTKVVTKNRNTVKLHDNSDFKLSNDYAFQATGLETDYTKIQAIEGFEDEQIDILLVRRDDRTKGFKLANFGLIMDPDFAFNPVDPRRIVLEATRAAAKLTDCYTEVTGLTF